MILRGIVTPVWQEAGRRPGQSAFLTPTAVVSPPASVPGWQRHGHSGVELLAKRDSPCPAYAVGG